MYLIKESLAQLNRSALYLRSEHAAFRVHYWGIDPTHYSNPVHKHSFFEICYVVQGSGDYQDGEHRYPLRAGTMFCSRPGITHQITSEPGMYLLFVAFELDESLCSDEILARYQQLRETDEVCRYEMDTTPPVLLWRALLVSEKNGTVLPNDAWSMTAHTLLCSLPSVFIGNVDKAPSLQVRYHLLSRAKLYIRDNLDQPLSLSILADYLNVSERHLSRLFAQGIHESFHQYVRKERIRKAVELLQQGDVSIKEIASLTGFATVHTFTRAFAMEMGIPPGRFRDERR